MNRLAKSQVIYGALSTLMMSTLLHGNVAQADIEGRIFAGYVDWETEAPDIVIPTNELAVGVPPEALAFLPESITIPLNSPSSSVYSFGIGSTYFFDRFFVDGYISTTTEDNFDLDASTGNIAFPGFSSVSFQESFDASRTDAAIAAGYAISERISAFVGYKVSSAEATSTFGTNSRVKVDHNGFFVGGTYAIPFNARGALIFNVALADLNGDFLVDINTNSEAVDSIVNIDADSESLGLSYGVKWKGPLNDFLNYAIQLNGYEYDFEDVNDRTRGPVGNYGDSLLGVAFSISHSFSY